MAASFAPKIRVNLVSPGFVMKGDNEPEEAWEERSKQTLLDNGDIVQSVLKSIRFLMTDPGMTGSEIMIDNGSHLHSKMKF